MSTRVCCICRWVGTGALVYCCRRIQEQIVCSERYAQPHPESSNLSCTQLRRRLIMWVRVVHSLHVMLQHQTESCICMQLPIARI